MALTLAVLCLATGLPAAEPQGQEVLLDVLVAQSNGSVIVGLDKEDFIVLEGDTPVDVESVTFYGDHTQLQRGKIPERLGLKLEDIPQERYFILLFHEQEKILGQAGQTVSQRQEAAKAAHEWLKTLLPNDFVAVLGYDTKLVAYTDFTRDPEVIATAIDSASAGKKPETPARPAPTGGPSLLAGLPEGRALVTRSGTMFGALELIGHAAEGITGRKNLLVFTGGFGQRNSRLGVSDIEITEAILALNAGNVTVYPVDLLNRASPTREMWLFVGETGGRFFENFREALPIVAAENTGYYLLRYHTSHRGRKRGLQRVQVTTTLPGALVRVRSGYRYGH
ncbi:MAG TPA: VWA domain-containing protein [Thermoanaerobaculia bacterium]|nr:VWA domain-containing protein [Thermoanaerobaculia bacterium]